MRTNGGAPSGGRGGSEHPGDIGKLMSDIAPCYVVVDANIWVAERLLQSSIGSAFLYAVTGAKSSILLPEVVELEVARVFPEMAERAVGIIKRELSLLRQLSGHDLTVTAPSTLAIEEGISERWKQLSGLIIKMPFTHDQAKSALQRVIRKAPPSGDNNEQFCDCCIWDAAVLMAADRAVHLVSADRAFYENRHTNTGQLAAALRAELVAAGKEVHIHSSLRDFLTATNSGATAIDEEAIGKGITEAIIDQAREIATDGKNSAATFQLGNAHRPKISGYATPKPSLVAISFEASFDLERTIIEDGTEARDEATMTLKGVCSYDPTTKDLSEIEIREWGRAPAAAEGPNSTPSSTSSARATSWSSRGSTAWPAPWATFRTSCGR